MLSSTMQRILPVVYNLRHCCGDTTSHTMLAVLILWAHCIVVLTLVPSGSQQRAYAVGHIFRSQRCAISGEVLPFRCYISIGSYGLLHCRRNLIRQVIQVSAHLRWQVRASALGGYRPGTAEAVAKHRVRHIICADQHEGSTHVDGIDSRLSAIGRHMCIDHRSGGSIDGFHPLRHKVLRHPHRQPLINRMRHQSNSPKGQSKK